MVLKLPVSMIQNSVISFPTVATATKVTEAAFVKLVRKYYGSCKKYVLFFEVVMFSMNVKKVGVWSIKT